MVPRHPHEQDHDERFAACGATSYRRRSRADAATHPGSPSDYEAGKQRSRRFRSDALASYAGWPIMLLIMETISLPQ